MAEEIEYKIKVGKDELNDALKSATENAGKAENAIGDLSDALQAMGKTKPVPPSLGNLPKETKETTKEVKTLTDVFSNANDELSRIKTSFIGNLGANVVAGAFNLLSDAFRKVVQDTRQFSRAIAEINSGLPAGTALTNNQTSALAKLSEQFGTSATAQAKGLFEAISNGVEDTAQAFQILRGANDAALSGLVDINTATKVITSTFNAYASSGVTATQVTDTLVAVTQQSGAKFEEIAQSMGRVTNVASQSGVSLGELGGTIAFLNARSLTTEQAITGVAGVIADISKPTKEALEQARKLGIEFNATALQSKGLVGFLEEVTKKTGGNVSVLRQLFADQRSANAVIAIASGEFSKYKDVVDKVTNSTGSASRASKVIRESFDFKLDKLNSSFNELALIFGQKLTPLITQATNAISLLKGALSSANQSTDETRNKLGLLSVEYNKNVDSVKRLQKELDAYKKVGADSSALATQNQLTKILERQSQIIKERSEIRGAKALSTTPPPPDDKNPKKTGVVDPIVEAEAEKLRNDTYNNLKIAREEFEAYEGEKEIANRELVGLGRQEDLASLINFEQEKINAKFLAEEQKNELIRDSKAKELAIETTAQKKKLEIAKATETQTKASATRLAQFEQQTLQTRLGYIQAFGNLGSALAKDGSKEQFLIQKASAIAGSIVATQLASAQALAVPPAPNVALASSARTIGNINTAAIIATAIKGFADGGIVGGSFTGASGGGDNVTINARKDEMFLNAQQQATLFNAINNGSLGSNQPIIIQIDGKEVFRAVRNQLNQGMKFA